MKGWVGKRCRPWLVRSVMWLAVNDSIIVVAVGNWIFIILHQLRTHNGGHMHFSWLQQTLLELEWPSVMWMYCCCTAAVTSLCLCQHHHQCYVVSEDCCATPWSSAISCIHDDCNADILINMSCPSVVRPAPWSLSPVICQSAQSSATALCSLKRNMSVQATRSKSEMCHPVQIRWRWSFLSFSELRCHRSVNDPTGSHSCQQYLAAVIVVLNDGMMKTLQRHFTQSEW